MADYHGAASEGTRAQNLMKKREKQKEELEKLKQKIADDAGSRGKFEVIGTKFASQFDVVEDQLRTNTVGLVTLEEMKMMRENIVQEREKKLAANLPTDDNDVKEQAKQTKKKSQTKPKAGGLSFDMDNEEEEEEEEEEEDSPPPVKRRRFGKNPTVDTSFLPDRDREEEERMKREKLRQEWVEKQDRIKNEEIGITYSYWDGSGHRRQVKMQKGNTIGQFLQRCLENLRKEFSELRAVSADSLMYIKEDLIIPQHYTFYDFIINKARGKSGPLFSFDVHEDVRLINDANMEKDESHAGKVVLRGWYERNKHIFPASRWEAYDPEKKWEKYTISDNKKTS